ncbi:MAG: sulfur oxidation c-type cytochrome SoxA, partial [bacterium]
MKIRKIIIAGLAGLSLLSAAAVASPEQDRQAFVNYFLNRFDVKISDYINGVYALDAGAHAQWLEIEEFPPYELAVDEGKALFEKPFANGKGYKDCFDNGGIAIRQNYPYFDVKRGTVITLELAINECREANGEKALKWKKGKIAAISAYMAYTSRGKKINTVIPDDAKALAAYEAGKKFFYSRRGQLNMSCAHCHVQGAGQRLRADITSPALGHVTHFPVYRSKWGELGTLHRRFGGCNKQVRAKPLKAQSEAYKNLEYFLSYMSNGLE